MLNTITPQTFTGRAIFTDENYKEKASTPTNPRDDLKNLMLATEPIVKTAKFERVNANLIKTGNGYYLKNVPDDPDKMILFKNVFHGFKVFLEISCNELKNYMGGEEMFDLFKTKFSSPTYISGFSWFELDNFRKIREMICK